MSEADMRLLSMISSPRDLRELTRDQLTILCEEIRTFIVRAVARSGGHLGPNLGVVELTVAIHRVFDSPSDAILWDTGHQAYVHKLLTGRQAAFSSLRQSGGLSGYPNRAESPHDWIENSHASTALSYAFGLAVAQDCVGKAEDRRIIAIVGDGALTGGMAYEALNNLGHSGRKVIIVLNDNGRSYAPTVSRLTSGVSQLRLHPAYMRARSQVERIVKDLPFGSTLATTLSAVRAAARDVFEPTAFFEDLGIRYTGPFDGHNIETLEHALSNAAEMDGPVVLHVLTRKGRGYAPAEQDDVKCLHDTGRFDVENGPANVDSTETYTTAFSKALVRIGRQREDVVAITAAMPGSTGLLDFQAEFPDRTIDVGIAEQHAVTSAAAMTMGGLRPIVAVYSTFLNRAFDQVLFDVGLHRCPVIFCVDRAGVTGDDGPSHHGLYDMALLTKVPGMVLLMPSSYEELDTMLNTALTIDDRPTAIRWTKTAARRVSDLEVGNGLKARRSRRGTDVCLVGFGKMLAAMEQAADLLSLHGVSATVWDPRVVPFDPDLIEDAGTHPLVVSAEDGIADGGVGCLLRTAIAETHPAVRVCILGVPNRFIPHSPPDQILRELGLDGAGIAGSVLTILSTAGESAADIDLRDLEPRPGSAAANALEAGSLR